MASACGWNKSYSMFQPPCLCVQLVGSEASDSVTVEDYRCVASGLSAKQDPLVGGKPPRSPILSRRSYMSPIRGRRVGGHVLIQP